MPRPLQIQFRMDAEKAQDVSPGLASRIANGPFQR
jgi:hypothetical protein